MVKIYMAAPLAPLVPTYIHGEDMAAPLAPSGFHLENLVWGGGGGEAMGKQSEPGIFLLKPHPL